MPTWFLKVKTRATNATMALAEQAEKAPDVGILRKTVQFAA
jgi:hypothetical protein